jgi:hypothetical protein
MKPTQPPTGLLLLTAVDHPWYPFLAAGLGLLAAGGGCEPAVYAAAPRPGGIFARHGGAVAGGAHHRYIARLLAGFRTTVVRHAGVSLFAAATRAGAVSEETLPGTGVADLQRLAALLGRALPATVLAVQTAELPETLRHGLVPYLLPLARARDAVPVPAELPAEDLAALRVAGVSQVEVVATATAAPALEAAWRAAGFVVLPGEHLAGDETYRALTFRLARTHRDHVRELELAEPVLAAERVCAAAYHGDALVIAEKLRDGASDIAEWCRERGQTVVNGRYAGGVMAGARNDEDLFPLIQAGIAFQVREPGRIPTLPLRAPPPVSGAGPFATEPGDDELRRWIREGIVPATIITHSGEVSHDECLPGVFEACSHLGLRLGIGMHRQRYEEDPDAIDQMLAPRNHGGLAELAEPLLHSAGEGIVVERCGSPALIARAMGRCRDRIRELVGDAATPRGVYCYLDADVRDWDAPATELWRAIRDVGFSYVISSVSPGPARILWRDGDFVVLNQTCGNEYPASPFIRLHRAADVQQQIAVARTAAPGAPRWVLGTIDLPVITDTVSLLFGDRYRPDHPTFGPLAQALTKTLPAGAVNTTPHVIARYARLLTANRE